MDSLAKPAVDPGSDAAVRLVAVLRVGGVDATGPGGEAEGAAVGTEDRDLAVLGEVGAECGPEGVRVGGGLLPCEEPGEPAGPGRVGALAVRGFGRLRRGGAVRGVGVAERDHARFGDLVHPMRTDEDFGDRAPGPTTAVCSDWYRLNLGAAMKSLNSEITGVKQVWSSPRTP